MSYPTYHIQLAEEHQDLLSALLMEENAVNGIEETEEGLVVYLKDNQNKAGVKAILEQQSQVWPLAFRYSETEHINWNAEWEANFKPITVGDYVGIRAAFHAPMTGLEHEIVIQPKMAFGTGHHATTWMMMSLMRDLDWRGKEILDFGTGTGILAILAAKEHAASIFAIDIEEEAYLNTLENAEINGVKDQIRAAQGQLDDVPESSYDIILANINRNVILESLPTLYQCLKTKGFILLSGLYLADGPLVTTKAEMLGFKLDKKEERNGWVAYRYQK